MAATKRLMLIDGHAMAYRAYHALPPSGAQRRAHQRDARYANILLKAIADYAPDYVARRSIAARPSTRTVPPVQSHPRRDA